MAVPRSYFAEIESGMRNPTLMTMSKIARTLKIRLSVLVRAI